MVPFAILDLSVRAIRSRIMQTITVTFVGNTTKTWTSCQDYNRTDTLITFTSMQDDGTAVSVELTVSNVLSVERKNQ